MIHFTNIAVLGLSGLEFVFFIASHMVLCFGFVTKTVDNTGIFLVSAEQCLHSVKASSLPPALKVSKLGIGKLLGGDIARTDDPK